VLVLLVVHLLDQLVDLLLSEVPHWHTKQVVKVLRLCIRIGLLGFLNGFLFLFSWLLIDLLLSCHLAGSEMCKLLHDLHDLRHGLKTQSDQAFKDDVTFDLVNLESLVDDGLDELDFVEKDLVVLGQFREHVVFSHQVELASEWEELTQNMKLVFVASDLA
jgi:hypothetical protein